MESGSHGWKRISNSLGVIDHGGLKWEIVEEKELADKSIGIVMYREYHRIWGAGVREKIQAEYILGKSDAPDASSITILRSVKPGRQHKLALKGFLSLLRQMK